MNLQNRRRRSHRRARRNRARGASGKESGEEKVESYLGQITAIDGNVISIALAEKPEDPDGEASTGEAPSGEKARWPAAPDGNGGAPNGEAPGTVQGEVLMSGR